MLSVHHGPSVMGCPCQIPLLPAANSRHTAGVCAASRCCRQAAHRARLCRRSFELYTHHGLQPGAEFSITYGTAKGNCELLRDYGFTLPSNPADDADVKADLRGFLLHGAPPLWPHVCCSCKAMVGRKLAARPLCHCKRTGLVFGGV